MQKSSLSVPLISFLSLNEIYGSVSDGFRIGIFQVVSALSTAGYSTTTYNNWSSVAILIMIILMLIGGGTGSTAGGIKLSRVHLMIKSIF